MLKRTCYRFRVNFLSRLNVAGTAGSELIGKGADAREAA
jgi:hypothetical protein